MNTGKTFARAFVPRTIRNWLRTPAKTVHYVVDRAAYACGSLSEVPVTDGWSVKCHPASRSQFEVFRTDSSQSEELAAFFAFAHPGMRLLDVGAHHGFFTLAALRAGGAETKVVCIEPSSKALAVLRANMEANGASSRVQIINAALGESDGRLRMLTTGPAGADYLVVPAKPRADTVAITVRTLQSVLDETGFKPTHVKLDIEGYELEVVQSATETLLGLKPTLYLELHGAVLKARGKDPADVIANLRRAGYRLFLSGKRPIDELMMAQQQFNCRLVCRP